MRLLNTTTLQLCEFIGEAPALDFPKYAILSHTWGPDELTFSDLDHIDQAKSKAGYSKVEQCCKIARNDGLEWAWVDTCCINKDSSAELSEAINSMFKWYQAATVCYAYLEDTEWQSDSLPTTNIWDLCPQQNPRWFGRGWTLQELIAPLNVVFYSRTWSRLGTKSSMRHTISHVTGIPVDVLDHTSPPSSVPVNIRISWASQRVTTRREDMAYCLLGIFDINMPLLYGEGEKAFRRLQEEILRATDDHGIYLGNLAPEPIELQENLSLRSDTKSCLKHNMYHNAIGLLASSPRDFHATITSGWPGPSQSLWTQPKLTKHTLSMCLPTTSNPLYGDVSKGERGLFLGALNYYNEARDLYLARYFVADYAPCVKKNAPLIYRALSQYSWVPRSVVDYWTSHECTIALDPERSASIDILASKMEGLSYVGGQSPRQPTGWHYSRHRIAENTAIEIVAMRGGKVTEAAFFGIDCREELGLFLHFSISKHVADDQDYEWQYRVFCEELNRLYEDSSSWKNIGTRTGPVHEVSGHVQVEGGSAELVATVYCDSRQSHPLCQAEFRFKDYKVVCSSEEEPSPEVSPIEDLSPEVSPIEDLSPEVSPIEVSPIEESSDNLANEEGVDEEKSAPAASANNGSREPPRQHVRPTPVVKEPKLFYINHHH